MRRYLLFSFFMLLFVVFAFPLFYSNYSQVVSNTQKITYELPFPGILPDHPLYIIKAIRDKAQVTITRGNIKKSELFLLLSDKRVYMAQLLAKKGKYKLAISTLSKGEKYFLQIPVFLSSSKKQGIKYSEEFLFQLKLSNAKHKEIIESMLRETPKEEIESLNSILQYNQKIKKELESL